MTTQPTCQDRVRAEYRSRVADLREQYHAETHPGDPCQVCKGTGDTGGCTCLPCNLCQGERTICEKCRMCVRCAQHIAGCVGCLHPPGQVCEYCDAGKYPEDGRLNEYGLSFDYVAPGTFTDQRRGYWCYQLSWGGPSDEFRFYCDERHQPVRIEYWFLDWFDGAKVIVRPGSSDWRLMLDLWAWFDDIGMVVSTLIQAR